MEHRELVKAWYKCNVRYPAWVVVSRLSASDDQGMDDIDDESNGWRPVKLIANGIPPRLFAMTWCKWNYIGGHEMVVLSDHPQTDYTWSASFFTYFQTEEEYEAYVAQGP